MNALPVGYGLEITENPCREQMAVLHPTVKHWSELNYILDGYVWLDAKQEDTGIASEYLNVHAESGKLVGTASLRMLEDEGELTCLAVDSEHQGQGIGRWLVAERIRRANMFGLRSLYVWKIDTTNTIEHCYYEHGFTAWSDSETPPLYQPIGRRPGMPELVRRTA